MRLISFILPLLMVLSFSTNSVAASHPFSDVGDDFWAKDEINYLYQNGIIKGYEDGTFRPNHTVTRSQAATMISGALKLDLENRPAPPFVDIREDDPDYNVIAALADEGIITDRDGEFTPNAPLTRGQMAAIFKRAFQLEGHSGHEFSDIREGHSFYDEIQALAANNIVKGYAEDNTYRPNDSMSRAQFSAFLARVLDDSYQPANGELEIHHLNVGQGDSTLILTPNGKTILIDAGTQSAGQKVVYYLKQAGVSSIDKLIITHAHADHVGGAVEVMKNFDVSLVLDSGIPHTTQTYLNYLMYIDDHDIPFEVAAIGGSINLDPALTIQIVNSGMPGDRLNDGSVALHLTYNEFTYLITGDAEEKSEHRIVEQFQVESDVLRVGHHGSRTSTTPYFIKNVLPKVAIISYGEDNRYGHPHPEVLELLTAVGVERVYGTAGGDVVLVSNGEDFEVSGGNLIRDETPKPPPEDEVMYPININTADFETLQYITGVGPTIAQRIIDYRTIHGSFTSIEEIKNVSGIGDVSFERMKDEITVG
ncbi:S-layer homology domain-containing protein [Alkalihalophilus lindianensis]|uniref:S-layer homology domain-containing protein n=1 Tax=Alkalihalophilus lindianensis TaxID=1630542 RepID=A0ABU3XE29_9BACI|nr:S-layer homology domain-containing protein [Alkalihalophilus lindianensis]MDV2686136.1 S-layer homology domain-containing protein [Alkalihalophilus lindianensis]